MNQKQTIGGTILSYMLIVLNAVYGIVLMPYIISKIGAAEYGVYKIVSSFTSALMVLDLGMGSTAIRYIAKFRVEGREDKIASCVKMLLGQAVVLSFIAVVVSGGIYVSLDVIYRNSLTADEVALAKRLFLVLSVSVIGHLFENVLNGVISGFNRFVFANGMKLLRLALKICLTVLLLFVFPNAIVLVTIDVLMILLLIVAELWYLWKILGIKTQKGRFEKGLFWEIFRYSMAVFTGAIVAQISNNLDNVVIGAVEGAVKVAIYSIALQLYNMFLQVGSSVSQILLPTVVMSIENDDAALSKTKELVIQVGRIQFMMLGAALLGFAVLGEQFIALLMKASGYRDAYYLTLILMIPAILELCINLCLAIIRAKNMLGYYTGILVLSAVMNLIITIVGTRLFNYYAAALGTAISLLLCRVLMMNAYYRRHFGFRMLEFYKQIIKGTWLCALLGAVVCYYISRQGTGWIVFAEAVLGFLLVYAAGLYVYGWNMHERRWIKMQVRKIMVK